MQTLLHVGGGERARRGRGGRGARCARSGHRVSGAGCYARSGSRAGGLTADRLFEGLQRVAQEILAGPGRNLANAAHTAFAVARRRFPMRAPEEIDLLKRRRMGCG